MSATEIALIKQQMENFSKSLEDIKKENSEAHEKLALMFEKAMETKASIWVEKALIWGISLVMTIVLSAIVYLVIQK